MTTGTTTGTAHIGLIHAVGGRAINWLYQERDRFRPRQDDSTTDWEVKDRLKPIGELAQIGKVLFREGVAGSQQAEQTRKLLDFAWRELLDGGQLLAWMQHEEPLSPIPFEIYLPFRELGYQNPACERAARFTCRLRSWPALEALPVRRLGISALERRFGLPPYPAEADALRATWLGQCPEPWTVDLHTAYSVTHTVFHLTDWGEHPEGLPPEIAEYLRMWLPAWLEDWWEIANWDLLGELLVVDACLPHPELNGRIWEAFAAAQAPSGAMPVQGASLPSGDPDDVFDIVYHSTLVAAFASALATSRAMGGRESAAADTA